MTVGGAIKKMTDKIGETLKLPSVSESVITATKEKEKRINQIRYGEIVFVIVDGQVDRLKYHEGDKVKRK